MKLTIKKFQELHQISLFECDEMEKSIMLVKTLTGKSDKEIDEMPVSKYNKLCKKINEAFELENEKMLNDKPRNLVRANGNWYWLNYDIAMPPMNAGKYVEIAEFTKDTIGNLHKIMATMATPVKLTIFGFKKKCEVDYTNHEKIANDMLEMEFKNAYHSAVFFWAVFTKSIQNFRNYFQSIQNNQKENQTEQVNLVDTALMNLQQISVGFIKAKWYQNLKV